MSLHTNRRGFDIRLAGAPPPEIGTPETLIPSRVALLGADYPGMRPTMRVREGDSVSQGAVLFEDKKTPGVRFTAPVAGRIAAIHRGERRAFVSVVIEIPPEERRARPSGSSAGSRAGRHPDGLTADEVRERLLESGDWTAIRARPFGRVAHPEHRPQALFVSATDTGPLAPDPVAATAGRDADLAWGAAAVSRLTDGPVFVCSPAGRRLPVPGTGRIRHEEFSGPHPSGSPGFHIHRLAPARRGVESWHLDAQDLAAIGRLFRAGESDPLRVTVIGGPPVRRPRYVRTLVGASARDLVGSELRFAEGADGRLPGRRTTGATDGLRIVSGSILSGRTAGGAADGFLGRYHRQVTLLAEDRRRRLLGWLAPGPGVLSATRAFASGFLPRRRGATVSTSTNGSRRAVIPIGSYERAMAFDIPAVFLARALLSGDVERAEELGVLELIEEDVGLLGFVCPGKNDYADRLRHVLDILEKEG